MGCTIDAVILEIPIELSFELDRPYTEGGSANLVFSAAVTFEEQAVITLIDAAITKIDIISMEIVTSVLGATPPTIETSLGTAPINDFDLEDFDLEVDTDDNGIGGPHRIELDAVAVVSTVAEGVDEVELGLAMSQVSLVLGDFRVPTDCLGPTLLGFSTSFQVGPSE